MQQPVHHSIKEIQGNLIGTALKVAIVVSRFNDLVVERLKTGALQTLTSHGVDEQDITVVYVPGAFELPLMAQTLADSHQYNLIITLGCVIRGGTPHFEYVCSQAASGISQAALNSGVPVSFGVLTTDTLEQALERAGAKAGNKGVEAALAGIEMANTLQQVRSQNTSIKL